MWSQVQNLIVPFLSMGIQSVLLWYMVYGGSGESFLTFITGTRKGRTGEADTFSNTGEIVIHPVTQRILTALFAVLGVLVAGSYLGRTNTGDGPYYSMAITFVVFYFALYLWLHMNRRISFYYAVIFHVSYDICDLVVFVILLRYFGVDLNGDASLAGTLLHMILSTFLQFVVMFIIKQFLEKDRNRSLSYNQIFLIVLAVIPYLYMRDLGYWLPLSNDDIGTTSLIALSITAAIALILIIGNEKTVYYHIQQNELYKLQQMIERQHELYEMRKESVELVNQKYHDMRHQLVAILGMEDVEEIHSYVRSIREEIRPFENFFHSGNPMLDVILTDKMEVCSKENIQLVPTVEAHALDFMDTADLCTIFGNALDNAIESCRDIPEESARRITLKVRTVRGFLVVNVENPCRHRLQIQNGRFLSTKTGQGDHGYGMEGIRHTVARYQGEMEAGIQEDMFIMTILIPL